MKEKLIHPSQKPERVCMHCEYFDFGNYKLGDSNGDCHNPNSPRFTPEPSFVCNQFYLSTTFHGNEYSPEKPATDTKAKL